MSCDSKKMNGHNEIILYQPDDAVKLEVRIEDETVWLTQQQMAELFETTSQCIFETFTRKENWT